MVKVGSAGAGFEDMMGGSSSVPGDVKNSVVSKFRFEVDSHIVCEGWKGVQMGNVALLHCLYVLTQALRRRMQPCGD